MPEDTSYDYDIIVLGAGYVGRIAAIACAAAGLRVCILEQQSQPPARTAQIRNDRALALHYGSVQLLQALDCMPDGMPITEFIWHASDAARSISLTADAHSLPFLGVSVSAALLADTLTKRCAEMQSVIVRYGVHVTDIDMNDAVCGIRFVEENKVHTLHARLLLCAAGFGAAQLCGIAGRQSAMPYVTTVCTLTSRFLRPQTAYQTITPDGVYAIVQHAGGSIGIRSMPHAVAQAVSQDDSLAAWCRYFPFLPDIALGTPHQWQVTESEVETVAKARCIVIGNAARTLLPITAQGLNSGIVDTAWLMTCLTACKTKTAIGSSVFLQRYLRVRGQHANDIARYTALYGRIACMQAPYGTPLRRTIAAVGRTAMAQRLLIRMMCGTALPLPVNH